MTRNTVIITIAIIVFLVTLCSFMIFKQKSKLQNIPWIDYVEKITANKKSGTFSATDKTGAPITLEWKIMNARSQEHAQTLKSLSDFMVQTWVPIEVDYYKAHPEEIMSSEHLKSFRPLFEQVIEKIDWPQVNLEMAQLIKSMLEADPKDFFGEHDKTIFVMAYDKTTNARLGFVQYLIKQDYPSGTVNLGNLAVDQEARNRGFGKLLTSTIFTLLPETKRIFLYTRPTNTVAQKAYYAYGFTLNQQPIKDPIFAKGWLMMEYDAKNTDILQREAQKIL